MNSKKSERFTDLVVWQKSHEFALGIYRLTRQFPKDELCGVTAQLRRAAVSVPANIAEGFKRWGKPDKSRFYNISQGSLEECRYYLILAEDLGYAETASTHEALEEVARLLGGYIGRLRS
jgi:four helix bundle protein